MLAVLKAAAQDGALDAPHPMMQELREWLPVLHDLLAEQPGALGAGEHYEQRW